MSTYRIRGYICASTAAVSYGMNPLFSLPMYAQGYGVNSVLFYRYFFAVIIYGLWLKFYKKFSFKISKKEAIVTFFLAIVFSLSSLLLFASFLYMDAGLACTILFSYPLMVALISRIFYKIKIAKTVWVSLFMIIAGVFLLYNGKPNEPLSIKGIVLVTLSALCDAIYMVGVKQFKTVKHIKTEVLSFYVMLFGLSVYVWNLKFCTQLQMLNNWFVCGCALLLALLPTIVSIETVTTAVKLAGATPTAILGALEPLTALFFGIFVFGETMTLKIIFGIIMILCGVLIVITNKKT